METNEQKKFWLRRAQQDCMETDEFKEDQQRLNLQLNKEKQDPCLPNDPKIIVCICFGNILLQIQNAPKHIQEIIFGSLGKQDRPFI